MYHLNLLNSVQKRLKISICNNSKNVIIIINARFYTKNVKVTMAVRSW